MPKLNQRKIDACRERISVPVSQKTYIELRKAAERAGVSPTRMARDFIERGLEAAR